MKMLFDKPPCWEEASKLFNLKENQAVFFTYGDTIFNPAGAKISDDLIRHEETHMDQQQADPEVAKLWWQRYLRDPEFRLDQEAEAYGKQYKFICQKHKDRNYRTRALWQLANLLAGEMYGSIVKPQEAFDKIKMYADGL